MIPIEGRIALGLDEFMLRFGHITTLAYIASVAAPRSTRLEREFGNFITKIIDVPDTHNSDVADYLATKRLCIGPYITRSSNLNYRYPDLQILQIENSKKKSYEVRSVSGSKVNIWWQDFCLSNPEIESCVGGITVHAKSGSTTGPSHIINWASILGLLNRDLSPSIECHLLSFFQKAAFSSPHSNPYLLSASQRTILAYLLLKIDLDVFVRLAKEILKAKAPIGKSEGARLFGAAIKELNNDLESQKNASHRIQFRVHEQIKELKRAQRDNKEAPLGSSSTAWHRASSRFESYVDLGLLKKRVNGNHERYEYVYYPTDSLIAISESFSAEITAQDWIEDFFMDYFGPAGEKIDIIYPQQLQKLLSPMISALGRPIQLFPIDILAIGICLQASTIGLRLTIRSARQSLESLARTNPEVARISRGSIGERAEFISLTLNKF